MSCVLLLSVSVCPACCCSSVNLPCRGIMPSLLAQQHQFALHAVTDSVLLPCMLHGIPSACTTTALANACTTTIALWHHCATTALCLRNRTPWLHSHCLRPAQPLLYGCAAPALCLCMHTTALCLCNHCSMAAQSIPNACATTALCLCSHCSMAAQLIPNACATTALWLCNCLMAAQPLPSTCAVSFLCLRNDCPMAAQLLPCPCATTPYGCTATALHLRSLFLMPAQPLPYGCATTALSLRNQCSRPALPLPSACATAPCTWQGGVCSL
ncbi:hypothetical protein DUNSADRAFT_852 [Dunaliella salina]|uniref:Uncharacterized protein n=1 Tax=Dunaliella salina TaxID=3046 RepID=A0ABQ7FY88_DUNSA|nr:hypothetical protein DUNSADRAFT_852 [Dunaliella salina]|eukprot:KAF5827328.1 hypothetical protein DUNSADRAFT_852 [Dunaliella salina]